MMDEIPYHNHDGLNSPKVKAPQSNLTVQFVQSGITASTGSTQATGVQIIGDLVEISVCANAGDSVRLPMAKRGLQILITNHGAASADIFPAVGDFINEAAVDTAKACAADATLLLWCYANKYWEALTLAR
jgi:hypothetical protein